LGLKRLVRRAVRGLGYEILKVPPAAARPRVEGPPPVEPVWPLPRRLGGMSDSEIRAAFRDFPHWHYAYVFEGGLGFETAHVNPGLDTDDPVRPLQRFRHFMPWLVQAAGGSLRGKRVLDIACNSGFWSIQCALLGADVVGFDARPELIAQAELIKRITGVSTAEFRVLDFEDLRPETFGGAFDIVLNLGLLYHLPDPLGALATTATMARELVLLDTAVFPSEDAFVRLKWEAPFDIRMAAREGIAAEPSKRAVELMLRHLGLTEVVEIPVRSDDLPSVYRRGQRASWLIRV
jgi:SAM-dependent methyltransferase